VRAILITMDVEFRRTGERRYTLTVHRESLPPLEFGAPGYDPLMPHDLQHFIAESELGMTRGIFGFLAAGGQTAGADHLPGEDRRAMSRRRRKGARRDERMLQRGARDQGDESERAAFICWYEWLRRKSDPACRKKAAGMAVYAHLSEDDRLVFTDELFARVCARMDELSAKWTGLAIGESFTVPWTVRVTPVPLRRRSDRDRMRA
jgi:hypothetical protein